MTPESVGLRENRMNLTSRSGSHMVRSRLAGARLPRKRISLSTEFYQQFIALADKKGSVYDDDLVRSWRRRTPANSPTALRSNTLTYRADSDTVATATARIGHDGKADQEAATGDGAVDAATKAIDRIVGFKITIENYHLESVTEGREAQGKVTMIGRAAEGSFRRDRHEHRYRGGLGAGIYGYCQ